jgi:hemerythrin-like metal-binding protein
VPKLPAWTDSLSVGNAVIDEQHRQLIASCNRLADFSAAQSPEAIRHFHHLLIDLMKLVDQHFVEEERFLLNNNCPSFLLHRTQHDEYREKLAVMQQAGIAGKLLAKEIYQFARDGLILHMQERDVLDKEFMTSIPSGC